jgi:hypothetical protein
MENTHEATTAIGAILSEGWGYISKFYDLLDIRRDSSAMETIDAVRKISFQD